MAARTLLYSETSLQADWLVVPNFSSRSPVMKIKLLRLFLGDSTGSSDIVLSAPVGEKLRVLSGLLEHAYRPSSLPANP